MVSGEPAPTVTWGRNKGEIDDPEKYKTRYDERAQEHILEVRKGEAGGRVRGATRIFIVEITFKY